MEAKIVEIRSSQSDDEFFRFVSNENIISNLKLSFDKAISLRVPNAHVLIAIKGILCRK